MKKVQTPLFPTVSPSNLNGLLSTYPITTRQILTGMRDYAFSINDLIDNLSLPWTEYTPTVTPQFGAFTLGAHPARYKLIGSIAYFRFSVTIVTTDTASGYITVTMPVTCLHTSIGAGREGAIGGKMLQFIALGGQSNVAILDYANAYPGGNGYVLQGNVVFEI